MMTTTAGSVDRERPLLSVDLKPVETLVARTDLVAMGRFVCHSSDALFRDSGPCTHHTVVFPRTATAVRRDDGTTSIADPTMVLFYNQDECYTRSKVSDVDECDWFVVADELLFDVVARMAGGGDPSSHPFDVPFVSTDPSLYLAQRRLFDRVESDDPIDSLGIDEAVVQILEAVIERASSRRSRQTNTRRSRAARERVEAVKREIASDMAEPRSLRELADIAECSTYELCRSFREVTGMRITEYRNALRTRVALAILRDGTPDLARLAQELGFSSHSHFTAQFTRAFAMPPSVWRSKP